jgi:hypothetical protein
VRRAIGSQLLYLRSESRSPVLGLWFPTIKQLQGKLPGQLVQRAPEIVNRVADQRAPARLNLNNLPDAVDDGLVTASYDRVSGMTFGSPPLAASISDRSWPAC